MLVYRSSGTAQWAILAVKQPLLMVILVSLATCVRQNRLLMSVPLGGKQTKLNHLSSSLGSPADNMSRTSESNVADIISSFPLLAEWKRSRILSSLAAFKGAMKRHSITNSFSDAHNVKLVGVRRSRNRSGERIIREIWSVQSKSSCARSRIAS